MPSRIFFSWMLQTRSEEAGLDRFKAHSPEPPQQLLQCSWAADNTRGGVFWWKWKRGLLWRHELWRREPQQLPSQGSRVHVLLQLQSGTDTVLSILEISLSWARVLSVCTGFKAINGVGSFLVHPHPGRNCIDSGIPTFCLLFRSDLAYFHI